MFFNGQKRIVFLKTFYGHNVTVISRLNIIKKFMNPDLKITNYYEINFRNI